MSADLSNPFEEAALHADEDFRALAAAGQALVAALDAAVASPDEASAEIVSALGEGAAAYLEAIGSAHGRIAQSVAEIAIVVEAEKRAFDDREVPLALDKLIGRLSKRAMRRRIEERAARAIGTERLRLTLGRADRLAGLIGGQRLGIIAQRGYAETAFTILSRGESGPPIAPREDGSSTGLRAPAQPAMLAASGLVVEALNTAVRDLTLLVHKLRFDVESLIDLYAVLVTFHRDREAHALIPDAYPHFTDAILRLQNGLLPGGLLAASRQRAEQGFIGRFGNGLAAR